MIIHDYTWRTYWGLETQQLMPFLSWKHPTDKIRPVLRVLTSRHKGVFNGNPSCLECQNIRNQIGAFHIFTPTTIWDFTEFLSWFIDVH